MDLPQWCFVNFQIQPGLNLKILNDVGRQHLESFGDFALTVHLNAPATRALRIPLYSVLLNGRVLCHTHDIYLANTVFTSS